MKNESLKVSFVGAGKLAHILAMQLLIHDVIIHEVFSRTKSKAKNFADKYNAKNISKIENLSDEVDVIILAVNDDAIASVVKKIKGDKLIVHCSGTVPMKALKPCGKNIGVLYPLQTFAQNKKIDFQKLPFLIEANSPKGKKILKNIATRISNDVRDINSEKRKQIHLAAVMVSNFTNHMYTKAFDYLKKNKMESNLLFPLIEQVTKNLEAEHPRKNQTGPAKRNDKKTIAEHLKMLHKDAQLKKIYAVMTESIIQSEKKK